MMESSEENKAKAELATSLKRKELQLELEAKREFQENLKMQNVSVHPEILIEDLTNHEAAQEALKTQNILD